MRNITEIQKKPPSDSNGRLEEALQVELSEWLARIEVLWKQKSRELWLKEGDRSTKFFHLSTIIRRRRNHIDAIKFEDGQWITSPNQIRKLFFNTFKNLFSEEEVTFPSHLENLMPKSITEEDNVILKRIPSLEEIKEALFQMQDLKALGPDGFPVLFYKEFWPIVGETVTQAVVSFFADGNLPKEANSSLIVLIPKTSNPTTVNNFRPISLCNVVYKIISKLVVAKFRPLLHKIISPCQSAFIPRRWIAENQAVHELLHSFKVRKVKSGFMALKLDLQKAYDRFNWKFIKAVLSNLGFNHTFINWIITCISSISFEVLVNGGKSDQFKSRMLDRELNSGNISGTKASVRGPAITHVMYADDIVLFSKATRKDAETLANCLEKYCEWSGQCLNRAKSGIFFSKHTTAICKRSIKHFLQMKSLKKDVVYLGAPLFLTRSPSKDFKFLQEKLESKLAGWKSKTLSWARRSTLITSVAQAIPSYTLSTFHIPTKNCDKLDSLTRRFWWKPKEKEGRFIAWKQWDRLW